MGEPGVFREDVGSGSLRLRWARVTTAPLVISVGRGALRESTHRVHAVVCRADGSVVRSWGNPDRLTLLRSVAKPFQAVPLVEDGVTTRFAITEAELALTCASHNSEDVHIAAARSILRKVGVDEAALVCGAHPPLLPDRAAELREMGLEGAAVTSNCSGKHAGMLALAVHHGWPTREYEQPAHPVQLRMVEEVARWTGLAKSDLRLETDGCGVPCFGVPLNSLARGAARFAQAVSEGQEGPRAVAAAMTGHPFMVAGSGRLCTALMATAEGGLFAKVGAEGVYAAGSPEVGMGVALKVEDGAWRAAPPALLAVLRVVGLLGETQWEALEDYHSPWVVNTVGDPVGRISADI